MNAFDQVRKITHMPGFTVTAAIDPKRISPRIKKSAQKMIRLGIVSGGYRSATRMLAMQLVRDAGPLPISTLSKWGVALHDAPLSHALKTGINELLQAGRMVELAGVTERYVTHIPHINDRYARMAQLVTNRHGVCALPCYVPAICMQIAELISASRTANQVTASEEIAARLDDTALIPANINTPI